MALSVKEGRTNSMPLELHVEVSSTEIKKVRGQKPIDILVQTEYLK